MKKWETLHKLKTEKEKLPIQEVVDLLLENRGITTKKDKEAFLHPKLAAVTPKTVGIDPVQLAKTLARISKAIDKKEHIVVFGDYDVDGITASAILWETLHGLGAKVLPYIPHRVDEGYGLSIKGITNQDKETKLIITVDNGIVAHEAVTFANEQGIDVIITDHHVADETFPDAYAIVHTTKLCGAGIAYLLAKELKKTLPSPALDTHLELATLGTVADMVPLTGANRAIVKEGLEKVCHTTRPGLRALYDQAGLNKDTFAPYDIGFVIAPRLNASGRIESAMDSLRLLCTTRRDRAGDLAVKLEITNKERQQFLKEATEHAVSTVRGRESTMKKLLIVAHESYLPGVIGLVAGKLVEEFYRPAIVLSTGETHSKASVRSVSGFNIIEFLRSKQELFINVGGHPMAAGFTVETTKLSLLQQTLEEEAEKLLTEEMLTRSLKIDCELPFSSLNQELYQSLQTLGPFGMGNPEPVFATRDVLIEDIRAMGKEGKHLRLQVKQGRKSLEAVAFGMGALSSELHVGDKIAIAYVLDENTWQGRTKLQLKVRDMRLNQ